MARAKALNEDIVLREDDNIWNRISQEIVDSCIRNLRAFIERDLAIRTNAEVGLEQRGIRTPDDLDREKSIYQEDAQLLDNAFLRQSARLMYKYVVEAENRIANGNFSLAIETYTYAYQEWLKYWEESLIDDDRILHRRLWARIQITNVQLDALHVAQQVYEERIRDGLEYINDVNTDLQEAINILREIRSQIVSQPAPVRRALHGIESLSSQELAIRLRRSGYLLHVDLEARIKGLARDIKIAYNLPDSLQAMSKLLSNALANQQDALHLDALRDEFSQASTTENWEAVWQISSLAEEANEQIDIVQSFVTERKI